MVDVAAAPEAMTPLIKRLRVNFGFTGLVASVEGKGILLNLNENGFGLVYSSSETAIAPVRVNHLHLFIKQTTAVETLYFGHFGGFTGARKCPFSAASELAKRPTNTPAASPPIPTPFTPLRLVVPTGFSTLRG